MTREAWLTAAVAELRPLIDEQQGPDYPPIRVSCGWPKGGGGKRPIGQCWSSESSADGHFEIFISPELVDRPRILDVLLHELIHACVGVEEGHRGEFKKLAKAVGLEGRMTATVAGEELQARLGGMVERLGPYPHAAMSLKTAKKQTTRMLKVRCANEDCACVLRMTRRWLDDVGAPTCACGSEMGEVS